MVFPSSPLLALHRRADRLLRVESGRRRKWPKRRLPDKDTLVWQTAAATLGGMGSRDAIPYLKTALDDSPVGLARLHLNSSPCVSFCVIFVDTHRFRDKLEAPRSKSPAAHESVGRSSSHLVERSAQDASRPVLPPQGRNSRYYPNPSLGP